jgi:arginyl-tRNA synthetase
MIESVNNDCKLNVLCTYIYTLARIIATGYDCYRVLENEHSNSRVCLFEAVRRIMEKCFDLLGIKPLEKI